MRTSDLRFLAPVTLLALTLNSVLRDPAHAALGAFLAWAAIAASEAVFPALGRSPAAPGHPALAWVPRLHVPLQLVLLAAGAAAARQADWLVVLGLGYAVGFITGALGITYAHELGHSRRRGDRALGWVLMTTVGYPQFMVEHYRGHHVRAATRDDPASDRPGESLWRFLPRTVLGSTCSAWRPWKPFPELEALPGPQLPTGYAGCILLAALPPLWFAVMHPRLQPAVARSSP